MSKEVKRYDPLLGLARNAKLRRMDMQCDPQWVLDLAAERDALLAERNAVAALLDKCRTHLKPAHDAFMRASKYEEGRHKPGHDLYMQIDALQGEQP